MNGQTHDFARPDALTIARNLLARGYKPLPIPIGAKSRSEQLAKPLPHCRKRHTLF